MSKFYAVHAAFEAESGVETYDAEREASTSDLKFVSIIGDATYLMADVDAEAADIEVLGEFVPAGSGDVFGATDDLADAISGSEYVILDDAETDSRYFGYWMEDA